MESALAKIRLCANSRPSSFKCTGPERTWGRKQLIGSRFFLADALFNLAMAINVYLTLFKKYNAQQLKALEWRYLLLCYGAPFIIALVYCFVETQGRGKIYGPAQLWCWVSGGWAFLRLVTFYVPAWICIFVSFTLYILAGREIFHKREELRAFRQPSRASVEEPFSGSKTTEVCVTSEHATFHILNPPPNCFDAARPSADNPHLQSTASPNGYEQYSTTINSSPESTAFEPSHRTSQHSTSAYKRYRAALETNAAAWRYTKVALLFFVSLCVTWIPSSINRIYDLAHPDDVSYPLNFISAIVLPLMGFWNGVIYFATTRAVCNTLFWDLVERCAPKRKVSSARSPRSSRKLSEAKEGKRLQSGSVTDSLTGFVMDSKRGDNAV
ncbi:MAG: hypothetical protein L6R41_000110 [Letrouitia leprolyta]|nr:MAG: hypothetical protein L6R41_000110 [Letrouitia leprolyta]